MLVEDLRAYVRRVRALSNSFSSQALLERVGYSEAGDANDQSHRRRSLTAFLLDTYQDKLPTPSGVPTARASLATTPPPASHV